jgi:signal transduction histidine kinase/ActR/RegA family two-component response regulator
VRQNALRLATFAAGELDRIIENGFGVLSALTRIPAVRDRDSAACSAYFAELKPLFPQFKVIGATDPRGNVFCASREIPAGFNLSDRPNWRRALETGRFTVGVYNLGIIAKSPVLPLSLAFRDMSGDIAGVVYVSLDLEWLAQYFAEKHFDQNATIAVADRDATILLRLPENQRYLGTKMPEMYYRLIYASKPGTADIVALGGIKRILGFVPINRDPGGIYVGIGLTREAAFAAINRATLIGLALLTAGFLLALAAAWIGGRRFISQPIASLAAAALHWRRGDFGVRVKPHGGGEIAFLGDAFNEMAAELAKGQRENATLLATLEQRVSDRTRELAHEVEERQKAETALVQAQKMEAIGQLTGGIAHDFNNLLTAVIGNLELAGMRLGGSGAERALRHIADARRSAERGARLTQDLLAFARKQSLQVEAVDLNAVVRSASNLLRRTVGPNVRIDRRLERPLWPALADSRQMELVILNLAINARDAMPGGGAITIETANVAAADPHRPAGLPAGDYVLLAVSDTGSGMTPEVLAKCLEPFFTTKEIGKGSGLGLSVVHGIATQSGGAVEIRSEPGQGTCVRVYLPRAAAELAPDHGSAPSGSQEAGDEPLAARVLLVDDDPDVREVLAAQLKDFGCSVVEAPNGDAALELLDDPETGFFDLLISDYAMPGLSGTGLARAARERDPSLPVLLVTGFNDLSANARDFGDWVWLSKPFRREELREHVRRAVAASIISAEPIA